MPTTPPTTPTTAAPQPSAIGIRLACAPVASSAPATIYSLVRYGRLSDALSAAARAA